MDGWVVDESEVVEGVVVVDGWWWMGGWWMSGWWWMAGWWMGGWWMGGGWVVDESFLSKYTAIGTFPRPPGIRPGTPLLPSTKENEGTSL